MLTANLTCSGLLHSGGTFAFLKSFLPIKCGVKTTFVDITDLAAVEAAITSKTKVCTCGCAVHGPSGGGACKGLGAGGLDFFYQVLLGYACCSPCCLTHPHTSPHTLTHSHTSPHTLTHPHPHTSPHTLTHPHTSSHIPPLCATCTCPCMHAPPPHPPL